jgi:hypothetical protein
MRKRAGPLAEISLEFGEIMGGGMKNFPYEHAIPLTEIFAVRMRQ